ncbi:MAG: type III-B CRISPR module RAMP protein Cmr4 [Candidatus Fermentithermobacillus carboniphilus]|uniref:Type III-B CRISPR module RAMP protein Cmr4 n=1 Tax=Candidatus Fermentithermobacillus carboniphilus TaxID=3085328 RepID=A0AAT9LBU2_9FIRM|nr:MAG: type III-B CRISPR module RAMP protein Cmr4 [Candidatus Fermentithermobacillus carboniphilus]
MPENVKSSGAKFGEKIATEILFIHALTSLHPGSGTALGVVDLPVQRERHTQWPVIPGSSLKGVLRDVSRRQVLSSDAGNPDEDVWIETVFGPSVGGAEKHAGAVSISDAKILAFPVRSLRGVFAWVTCPAVLERFNRDLALIDSNLLTDIPHPDKDTAVCADENLLLADRNRIMLEEFEFAVSTTQRSNNVAAWIADHGIPEMDEATRQRFKRNLVVLHDDDFTYFVRHATEVVARIGLDYQRKTVKEGALFYQEFIPPETVFYSVIMANSSRREGHPQAAAEVLDRLNQWLPKVVQVGGDETIGKGLCALRVCKQGVGA